MERVCFTLQVRTERLEEYTRRHAEVWPSMLAALAANGWHNYSLFLRPDGLLIGYVETPSLRQAQAAMDNTEVNALWQQQMAPFFEGLDDANPDTALQRVAEIFHLEDQLAALKHTSERD